MSHDEGQRLYEVEGLILAPYQTRHERAMWCSAAMEHFEGLLKVMEVYQDLSIRSRVSGWKRICKRRQKAESITCSHKVKHSLFLKVSACTPEPQ